MSLLRYLPLAATLALAACNVAKPAPQRFDVQVLELAANPAAMVAQIEANATAAGFAVVSDGTETVFVDFGTREMTIPVPTEYGLWGARTVFRTTAVKPSAVYRVLPTATGVRVTVHNNPIYWHPDVKAWLPGPHDVTPSGEWLAGLRLEAAPVTRARAARPAAPRATWTPQRPATTAPPPPAAPPRVIVPAPPQR